MKYRANPIEVQAVQVGRPFRDLSKAFPRSHVWKSQSGAFQYLRLLDAPEGANRAYEGDWIVTYKTGIEVLRDAVFRERFSPVKEGG